MSVLKTTLKSTFVVSGVIAGATCPGGEVLVVESAAGGIRLAPVTRISPDTFDPNIRVGNCEIEYSMTVLSTATAFMPDLN